MLTTALRLFSTILFSCVLSGAGQSDLSIVATGYRHHPGSLDLFKKTNHIHLDKINPMYFAHSFEQLSDFAKAQLPGFPLALNISATHECTTTDDTEPKARRKTIPPDSPKVIANITKAISKNQNCGEMQVLVELAY